MNRNYIDRLLQNNRDWVQAELSKDPRYFERSAQGQAPQILWLGCSDSRILPNDMTGTDQGELFMHRNIANLVVSTDLNFLSVLQYAVEYLQVGHIVVCGHYDCGGVEAAMKDKSYGLIDNWIRPIKDTMRFYQEELEGLPEGDARCNRLVELNVKEQVAHLGATHIVRQAWQRGQTLYLHGWVYDLHTGHIRVLADMIDAPETLMRVCKFERQRQKREDHS